MSKVYVPPSLRKQAPKKEVNSLAPENFPTLGGKVTVPKGPPALDFLGRIEAAEEKRREQALKEASYDPEVIATQTPEQLAANGWACLYLTEDVVKGTGYFMNLGMTTKQALASGATLGAGLKPTAKAAAVPSAGPEDDYYEEDYRDCYGAAYTLRGAEVVYEDECNFDGNDL